MTDFDPRSGRVHCHAHGDAQATYVCGHLARGTARQFFCAHDPGNPRPDAWCEDCERQRLACGGQWTEEIEATLGVQLLCGGCYDALRARARPGATRLSSQLAAPQASVGVLASAVVRNELRGARRRSGAGS